MNASSEEQLFLPLRQQNPFPPVMGVSVKHDRAQGMLEEDREDGQQPDPHTQDMVAYSHAKQTHRVSTNVEMGLEGGAIMAPRPLAI